MSRYACADCMQDLHPDQVHFCSAPRPGTVAQCTVCRAKYHTRIGHWCQLIEMTTDDQAIDEDIEARVAAGAASANTGIVKM